MHFNPHDIGNPVLSWPELKKKDILRERLDHELHSHPSGYVSLDLCKLNCIYTFP